MTPVAEVYRIVIIFTNCYWEEGPINLETRLAGSVLPWLLGGLLLLDVALLLIAARAWREAKRSPYFFLRQQAAKSMRRNMGAALVLILITAFAGVVAWQTPASTPAQFAPLSYAKPLPQSVSIQTEPVSVQVASPESVEINFSADKTPGALPNLTDPLLKPTLPDAFNQKEPTVELKNDTQIGQISFSTDISNDYQAINPGRRFAEGFFTLYATFAYEEMADGMTWSWVWKHNGSVVEGENESWSYGEKGPGYIYFTPDAGFHPGEYVLEVWVNGEMMSLANFMVTDSIAASN